MAVGPRSVVADSREECRKKATNRRHRKKRSSKKMKKMYIGNNNMLLAIQCRHENLLRFWSPRAGSVLPQRIIYANSNAAYLPDVKANAGGYILLIIVYLYTHRCNTLLTTDCSERRGFVVVFLKIKE